MQLPPAESYSKYRDDWGRTMSKDCKKRIILVGACLVLVFVISYANVFQVSKRRQDYVVSWELASKTATQGQATLTLPKIIHQTWAEESVPSEYEKLSRSWKQKHPGWEYKLWSTALNLALVKDDYPWLLEAFEKLPSDGHRADIARYLYMSKFGGVYADMNVYCAKPVEGLLAGKEMALAYADTRNSAERMVTSSFMASQPSHQFWYFVLAKVRAYLDNPDGDLSIREASDVTGTKMLTRAVHHFGFLNYQHDNVTVLDPGVIVTASAGHANCSFRSHTGTASTCADSYPDAYMVILADERPGRGGELQTADIMGVDTADRQVEVLDQAEVEPEIKTEIGDSDDLPEKHGTDKTKDSNDS